MNLLLGSLQKGDVAGVLKGAEEVSCLKGLIAKALGTAIILGSCILKVLRHYYSISISVHTGRAEGVMWMEGSRRRALPVPCVQ